MPIGSGDLPYEGYFDGNSNGISGLNITAGGIGIGSGTGTNVNSFSSMDILTSIYSSMSAIATSANGTTVGAITALTFSATDNIPTAYSVAQGAYIVSAGALTITVGAIEGSIIAVKTATSLGGVIVGGSPISPEAGTTNTYIITGASGTWVLIKATSTSNPSLSRSYTLYLK